MHLNFMLIFCLCYAKSTFIIHIPTQVKQVFLTAHT